MVSPHQLSATLTYSARHWTDFITYLFFTLSYMRMRDARTRRLSHFCISQASFSQMFLFLLPRGLTNIILTLVRIPQYIHTSVCNLLCHHVFLQFVIHNFTTFYTLLLCRYISISFTIISCSWKFMMMFFSMKLIHRDSSNGYSSAINFMMLGSYTQEPQIFEVEDIEFHWWCHEIQPEGKTRSYQRSYSSWHN